MVRIHVTRLAPNAANRLHLGKNASRLAQGVRSVFDTSSDADLLQVSKYASLVDSISAKISTLDPQYPAPAPKPTDDEGMLNVMSYITEWASTQAEKAPWKLSGMVCAARGV
mgnify:CR=1 FL=1